MSRDARLRSRRVGAPPDHARPPAVIIGLDSATGLQVARILADRGVTVVGLTDRASHWACRTRLVSRVVEVGSTDDELLAVLGDPTLIEPGSVLIPCTDQSVLSILAVAEQLRPLHRFSDPPAEAVERLLDKARFGELAEANGVRTPRTVTVDVSSDWQHSVKMLAALRAPWVVKPAVKDERWLTGAPNKALRLEGPERFEAVRQALGWADSLLVQEWIDGPDSALVTCNCYIDPGGVPEAAVVSAKLRQWPPDVGTASAAVTVTDDAVVETTERLLTAAGFTGFGYVEYKRAGDELVAIEANVGRPTGRSAMAEAAGVELHYALYADLAGIERDPLGSARPGVTWLHLRRDLQAAVRSWRRGGESPWSWFRSLRRPRVEAVARLSDPAPFLLDLWSTAAKQLPGGSPTRLIPKLVPQPSSRSETPT